ncbi:hypothetical protein [Bacillus cihuensis]|uniref:hypothetical protein n=1 Tax=Bacillus cihuensis TaxID=1208599 RepID=UPI001F43EBD4|nr:hypothetical protein [Bacillus cihuensis]
MAVEKEVNEIEKSPFTSSLISQLLMLVNNSVSPVKFLTTSNSTASFRQIEKALIGLV